MACDQQVSLLSHRVWTAVQIWMACPGRSENHSSKNFISKNVMLFVFVAYNGDMSPDDIISADIIRDILSDGTKNFVKNLEKMV